MKKLVFFIPAIVFTVFYGGLAVLGLMSAINPIVIIGVALLWIAGILLSKTIFWGGLLGAIPALCFIYMGTQETGQIVNEMPAGIIILLYYLACMYWVYRKRNK